MRLFLLTLLLGGCASTTQTALATNALGFGFKLAADSFGLALPAGIGETCLAPGNALGLIVKAGPYFWSRRCQPVSCALPQSEPNGGIP